jgi:hypothetical protein
VHAGVTAQQQAPQHQRLDAGCAHTPAPAKAGTLSLALPGPAYVNVSSTSPLWLTASAGNARPSAWRPPCVTTPCRATDTARRARLSQAANRLVSAAS